MKEYLIAFRYLIVGQNWNWASIVKVCKMTGANLKNIEDEIRNTINADVVCVMTFSELESDSEGV